MLVNVAWAVGVWFYFGAGAAFSLWIDAKAYGGHNWTIKELTVLTLLGPIVFVVLIYNGFKKLHHDSD